jgi:dsDNA-binding SOS-regulon protein
MFDSKKDADAHDKMLEQAAFAGYNRRGSKDSQLR